MQISMSLDIVRPSPVSHGALCLSGFDEATPMSIVAESSRRRPAERPAAPAMDAKRSRSSPAAGQSPADASAAAAETEQPQPQQSSLAACVNQLDVQLQTAACSAPIRELARLLPPPELCRSTAAAVPTIAGAGALVSVPTTTSDDQQSDGAGGQPIRAESATLLSPVLDELLASHGMATMQSADSERLPESRPLWAAAKTPSQLPERLAASPAQMPSATTMQLRANGIGGTTATPDTGNTCEQRDFTAEEAMRFIAGKLWSPEQLSYTESLS